MNDSPSYSFDVQNSGRILEFDTKTPGTNGMIIFFCNQILTLFKDFLAV